MSHGIGVLWPGDPTAELPPVGEIRLRRVLEELTARGVSAEPVVYADEVADQVRGRLLELDGVLVWVNPIVSEGRDRLMLNDLLREVASQGVFVSAHPDVILKMGTKDVLVRTSHLPWGSDTVQYHSLEQLRDEIPARLREGPRVIKQLRGNDGNGVWKVEQLEGAHASRVRLQHARAGTPIEELSFGDAVLRFQPYFDDGGSVIDQPYQPRLAEGMVRCYMAGDKVAGFGHQFVTALLPAAPGEYAPPAPPRRLYYGPHKPEFQPLKEKLESGWIEAMRGELDIARESLPVIWDADFLLGPRDDKGQDTYVLCEINVSSVFPIPDEAVALLVEEAIRSVTA